MYFLECYCFLLTSLKQYLNMTKTSMQSANITGAAIPSNQNKVISD